MWGLALGAAAHGSGGLVDTEEFIIFAAGALLDVVVGLVVPAFWTTFPSASENPEIWGHRASSI